MKSLLSLGLVSAFCGAALAGPPASYDPTVDVENAWANFASHHPTKGAVVVVVGRGYLWWYQFGWRDDAGNPMTLKTPIAIASNSKTFVATDLSLAEDAHVVGVNTMIGTLMPTLSSSAMPRDANLRQLASYTSGLPRDIPQGTHYYDSPALLQEALEECSLWSNSCGVPGGHTEYSNFGYAVLGDLLASVRGKAQWSDLVEQEITDPLGMSHTCTRGSGCNPTFPSTHAHGFRFDGSEADLPDHTPISDAAGGMWSTGEDMATWLEYQVGGIIPSSDPATTKLNAALAKTTQPLNGTGWSYEFDQLKFKGDTAETRVRGKRGFLFGHTSFMGISDTKHVGIFVYVNNDPIAEGGTVDEAEELRDKLAFPILKNFN